MIPKIPPGRSKINRRRLENLPPEAPKWCQNGSKMAPRRPPGAEAGFGGLCGPLRGGPGRLLGPSGVALGASWGRRGPPKVSPEAPRGSPGGSRRASGTSFWKHFCSRACRQEKSKKNKHVLTICRCCFYIVVACVFFTFPAAAAQARTLRNIGFHSEGIANFACRPFSRGTKKEQIP